MISFGSINVNAIDTNSGIFTGNNMQSNWRTQTKTNSGFGNIRGKHNVVAYPLNIVIDPDTVDNPSYREYTSSKVPG